MKIDKIKNNQELNIIAVKKSQNANGKLQNTSLPYSNFSYPKNYYISFQKRKTYEEFYEEYEQTMPLTVKNYIDIQKYLCSKDEFNEIKSGGFIAFHRLAFENLNKCKTVDDIKKAFPDEPVFKNLKTLDEVSKRENSVFYQLSLLQKQGVKILDSEDDITTFIVKKFYLECREYKEVFDELYKALTPEAKQGKIGELLDSIEEKRKSSSSFYHQLGIVVPDGRSYPAAVRFSNPDYKTNRKRYFSTLSAEETNEKVKQLLDNSDTKARYSMIDAWNQCETIREDLSKFITECMNNPEFYSNNASFDDELTVYDSKTYTKFRKIMIAFWNKYPEYKEQLGEEVAKAIERYNKIASLGEEELKKHIQEVENKSNEIRKNIQLNKKKNQMLNYANAIELLTIASRKANIFGYKSDSVILDFQKLLLGKMTQEELVVLEGDRESQRFKELVPKGIKAKMQELTKTPEFANVSNAHHIALLQEALNNITNNAQKEKLIEEAKKSIRQTAKNIAEGVMSEKIDFNNAELSYNRLKSPLSKGEISRILNEIMNTQGVRFNKNEEENVENLVKTQGAYLKYITGDNELKPLVQILFLDEYDKLYGTKHKEEAIQEQSFDKIALDAINNVKYAQINTSLFSW